MGISAYLPFPQECYNSLPSQKVKCQNRPLVFSVLRPMTHDLGVLRFYFVLQRGADRKN
jgi:hypothetical protein